MPTDLNLLRHLLPRVDALGSTQVPTLERTATPAEIIDAGHPVARLERAFRSPHLDSVLVHRVADDRMGLVTRSAFFASLSGDLGFGRALLARGVVADVADWQPLVLDGGAGVVEAALALTERSDDRRYDPVVVRCAEWKLAAPADVVRALMALLAVRSLVDEPTGLAYGAHPARTSNSSVTTFSVLYLTDAGNGNIWMLEPASRRATLVGTGFSAPTGVAWAACTNPATGAVSTLSGVKQCLYVADTSGVRQMPLRVSSGSVSAARPIATDAADSVRMSAAAAVKVTTATALHSSEGTGIVARAYQTTTASTATGVAPAGSTFIPAAITRSTDLIVFADAGDHTIKKYNPATPGTVTVVAGNGTAGFADAPGVGGVGTNAAFNSPKAVHFHGNWPYVYIADTGNGLLRRVDLITGDTTTLYGTNPLLITLRDSFTRVNNTNLGVTEIGRRAWQKAVGTAQVSSNQIALGATGVALSAALVETYSGDVTVQAALLATEMGVVARWQDPNNYLRAQFIASYSWSRYCTVQLVRVSGGVETTLSSVQLTSEGCIAADFNKPIGIRTFAGTAQLMYDGVALTAPVASSLPASLTRHGIWSSGAWAKPATNFSVVPS